MAQDQESRSKEDLTEEPSSYRLEEYRRKGIVSQSREVSAVVALLGVGVTLYVYVPEMATRMLDYMRELFRTDLSARVDLGSESVLKSYLLRSILLFLKMGFPICAAGFVFGALASFLQIGPVFSWDPLTPNLERLDPLQGIKKLFSLKQMNEGARLSLKVGVLLVAAYYLVKSEVLQSPIYLGEEPTLHLNQFGKIAWRVFTTLLAIFASFSAMDFWFQREDYLKNLRMTKQEAKQEQKEREGDPQIRARVRSIQREMARRRMMQAVKKADVIVTNPTHIAVALVYQKDKMSAPKVVAKGADFMAQKMKEVAGTAGVPLVENVPLARALYKSVKIGQAVPRSLYQAVAEVLAYVYRLRARSL